MALALARSIARARILLVPALACSLAFWAAPRAARADEVMPVIEPGSQLAPSGPPPSPRPKFDAVIGMGASFDSEGMTTGASAVPAFFVKGGVGQGIVGVDLGAFVNSASGRFRSPNLPVDRLALDVAVVVRPLADRWPDDPRYGLRVLRTLAADIGLGVERASRLGRGPEAVYRFGSCIGLHVDVPLTASGPRSELRLRLAGRRFVGASHVTFPEGDAATDTRGELFAALATVF